MLRFTALAGALLCLIFTVSAEAQPRQVCANTDVMRPCGPNFKLQSENDVAGKMSRTTSKREARPSPGAIALNKPCRSVQRLCRQRRSGRF